MCMRDRWDGYVRARNLAAKGERPRLQYVITVPKPLAERLRLQPGQPVRCEIEF